MLTIVITAAGAQMMKLVLSSARPVTTPLSELLIEQ
jgi:hypothetical protein